jgi:hypothetical protein
MEDDAWKSMIDGGTRVHRHSGVVEPAKGERLSDEDRIELEEDRIEAAEDLKAMMGYFLHAERITPEIQNELRSDVPIMNTKAAKVLLRRTEYVPPQLENGGVSLPPPPSPPPPPPPPPPPRFSWIEIIVNALRSFFFD